MASEDKIIPNLHPLCTVYENGRVVPTVPKDQSYVPPGLDPATGVDSKDVVIESDKVTARLYLPPAATVQAKNKLPILVYYHGGGFFIAESNAFASPYHELLNTIVSQAGAVAVSVNYRLVQQARLPAAYEDSMVALKWVFSRADPWISEHGDINRVFLAGDSAGGNISNYLAMELGMMGSQKGENPKRTSIIKGIALLCPYYVGEKPIPGEDLLMHAVFSLAWRAVLGPDMTLDDWRVNPLAENAPSLRKLVSERAFVVTGGLDPLKWRGNAYGEKLKESKGWGDDEMMMKEYAWMGHVFFMGHLQTEESKDMMKRLVAFINQVN